MRFAERPFDPDSELSARRTAIEARERMEAELHCLAAVERELDRLDRQLSVRRARLARGGDEPRH